MNSIFSNIFHSFPELKICQKDLFNAFDILKNTYQKKGKLLICGNGGSAADSEHIVGELMKGFIFKRQLKLEARKQFIECFPDEGDFLADHLQGALPAISLVSHSALISAFANDVSAETIYAQQVYGYGLNTDALLAISTSGNSINIIRAVQVAKVMGLASIGLSGRQGGRLQELCDVTIKVPADSTYQIQELHLPVYHALCIALENEFFSEDR
jgi:D-sedoheptulose 7-phosphate isomerase